MLCWDFMMRGRGGREIVNSTGTERRMASTMLCPPVLVHTFCTPARVLYNCTTESYVLMCMFNWGILPAVLYHCIIPRSFFWYGIFVQLECLLGLRVNGDATVCVREQSSESSILKAFASLGTQIHKE
jgi:hypothetical protein